MQHTISFLIRFVTIIVIVADLCSCYSSEDRRPLNRSQITANTGGKRNESLTTPPPQNTEKKNDSLTAPSQNTGKNNESSVMPAQNGTVDKFECRRQPCVRKCCADGQVFRYQIDIEDRECVEPFDNETYSFADRLKRLKFSPETNESSSFVGIEYGKGCEGYDFLNYPNDTFTLLNGGSQIDFQTYEINGSMTDFCMEFIANENRLVPLLCPKTVIEHQKVPILYPITLSISALFMMATVFVYYIVGKLKTLYGKLLLCHATSLTIGYLFLIPTQIFNFYDTCKPFCFVAAIGVQFFFLAAFFWLSVISFDIWRSFRRFTNPSYIRNNRKRFIHYSTYAWGCPIIITSITLLAQFWHKMSEIFPHPNLADKSCGFGDKAKGYYFYGPLGIVLILNMVIFCAVYSKYIKKRMLSSKILSQSSEIERHIHVHQTRFGVCLKLFIVMGVCWIMEVVSALADLPEKVSYVTDMCNGMQGVAIFFITICNRKISPILQKKFNIISLQSIRPNSSSGETTRSLENTML